MSKPTKLELCRDTLTLKPAYRVDRPKGGGPVWNERPADHPPVAASVKHACACADCQAFWRGYWRGFAEGAREADLIRNQAEMAQLSAMAAHYTKGR